MTNSAHTIAATIHALPASEVYSALNTQPRGLSQVEASTRLQQVGRNALQEIKRKQRTHV